MPFVTFSSDIVTNIAVFTIGSLLLTVWYYIFHIKPYADIPSCRLELRVLYWFLTGRYFNRALLQTLVGKSKQHYDDGMFVAWAGQPLLVIYGEDIVKMIVNEPAATEKPENYKAFESFVGKGIMTSKGENFRKHRRLITPAFGPAAVKSYTAAMNKNAGDLVKMLSNTESRPTEDIIEFLNKSSMRVLWETNFGDVLSDFEDSLIIQHLKGATKLIVKKMMFPWLYPDILNYLIPSCKEVYETSQYLKKTKLLPGLENIKTSVVSRQSSQHTQEIEFESGGKKVTSLGEIFVEQHLKDPTITMEDLSIQISYITAAGFDTIVHSMKFALFMLGLHPDVQERAREEVEAETRDHITYEDVHKLTYLDCVLKESQRLYPIPLFGRYLRKDLQWGKYHIPKDTDVLVFSYMVHRNPEIYPDPEKFDPERFMNKDSRIRQWNFIPFAESLRPCPGKNYARIQMLIFLAHILKNFKIISLDRREDLELQWCIVLDFTKKLRMQFVQI